MRLWMLHLLPLLVLSHLQYLVPTHAWFTTTCRLPVLYALTAAPATRSYIPFWLLVTHACDAARTLIRALLRVLTDMLGDIERFVG